MQYVNVWCMWDSNADSLQAEGGHPQGDACSKLSEEHVEGVEDGFMAFTVGVSQSEVIHHIWQHRPELHTHTCKVECTPIYVCLFFFGRIL